MLQRLCGRRCVISSRDRSDRSLNYLTTLTTSRFRSFSHGIRLRRQRRDALMSDRGVREYINLDHTSRVFRVFALCNLEYSRVYLHKIDVVLQWRSKQNKHGGGQNVQLKISREDFGWFWQRIGSILSQNPWEIVNKENLMDEHFGRLTKL